MKRLYVIAIALLSLPLACTMERPESFSPGKTLTSIEARVSEMPQTKANLEDGSKIKWELNESVAVFSNTDNPVVFSKKGNGNKFTGDTPVSGTQFYAFYPVNGELDQSNRKKLTFYVNDTNCTAGGKAPSFEIPMIAKSDGLNFDFKQTCGILHFAIKGTQKLESVALQGNNSERLFGAAQLNLDDDVPALKFSEEDQWSMRWFYPQTPVQLSETEAYDVYFVLPPMSFANGFKLTLNYDDNGTVSKETTKTVTISRAIITNYSVDINGLLQEKEDQATMERNALIEFYNAMGGHSWSDNTNWCSDKPIGEWSNVWFDGENVTGLTLWNQNINGSIPESFSNLKNISFLQLVEQNGEVSNFDVVFSLKKLTNLIIGKCLSRYDEGLMITIPEEIGNLKNLTELIIYGAKGTLPGGLFQLDNLSNLEISVNRLEGTLPSDWSHMRNLRKLRLGGAYSAPLAGTLPKDLFNCTNLEELAIYETNISGELPHEIGNLSKLNYLGIPNNMLSGPLPAELAQLNLTFIELTGNSFSGKIPQEFAGWPTWDLYWGSIVFESNLDMSEAMPHVPAFDVELLSGDRYTSQQIQNNSLTVLFKWATWCTYCPEYYSEFKKLYASYKDNGFEIVSWSTEDAQTVEPYVAEKEFPWKVFAANWENCIGDTLYPNMAVPDVLIFDSSGKMVYYSIGYSAETLPFILNWYGDGAGAYYESSDYSADGTVHVLQTATVGNGIDLVLMGDGYSDRLIADGSYAKVMSGAMEAFFAEEPYASYRNCFNVSYVDIVSKNEDYRGRTALNTWYGQGTAVGGDDRKVMDYASIALSAAGRSSDDALILVMMNRDYYAGTCYMYGMDDGDYGRGMSIAYMPVSSVADVFGSVLRHEAGGHGFAKLADEYSYASNGAISQEAIDGFKTMEPYGWWRNVDFTSDPAAVKWSQFISDNRYASEGIGVYEGACTYWSGAYRPTQNSIMNDNTGGFNAPSRYAIWYRINKLANGSGWTGTYDDFAAWDLGHANNAPRRAKTQDSVRKALPPLAPPVVKKLNR